jgi:hypothetical protein
MKEEADVVKFSMLFKWNLMSVAIRGGDFEAGVDTFDNIPECVCFLETTSRKSIGVVIGSIKDW